MCILMLGCEELKEERFQRTILEKRRFDQLFRVLKSMYSRHKHLINPACN